MIETLEYNIIIQRKRTFLNYTTNAFISTYTIEKPFGVVRSLTFKTNTNKHSCNI